MMFMLGNTTFALWNLIQRMKSHNEYHFNFYHFKLEFVLFYFWKTQSICFTESFFHVLNWANNACVIPP